MAITYYATAIWVLFVAHITFSLLYALFSLCNALFSLTKASWFNLNTFRFTNISSDLNCRNAKTRPSRHDECTIELGITTLAQKTDSVPCWAWNADIIGFLLISLIYHWHFTTPRSTTFAAAASEAPSCHVGTKTTFLTRPSAATTAATTTKHNLV